MKILQINKFHYLKDGASRSYFETARLLKQHGHEVAFFSMIHPDNQKTVWSKYFVEQTDYNNINGLWPNIKASINIIYNRSATRNLEKLIKEFNPDVAHLHIIYHQLSPSIINVLKKYNIPVVMTLHDYKVIAPNYTLFYKGEVSYRACGGRYYQCLLDKAIKNSYAKSFIAMFEAYLHNKILKTYNKVDCFIAPSEFMKSTCVRFGLPENKIKVVPHFVSPDFLVKSTNNDSHENYILYAGRLSEEKGVESLLRAMSLVKKDVILKIAGSGPQEKKLRELAQALNINNRVEFLGNQDSKSLIKLMRDAHGIVIPSVWLEVFGYVAIEALAQKTPVIAARIGALPEIIKDGINGFLFKSGDTIDLAKKINILFSKSLSLELRSDNIAKKYGYDTHYSVLAGLYAKYLTKF